MFILISSLIVAMASCSPAADNSPADGFTLRSLLGSKINSASVQKEVSNLGLKRQLLKGDVNYYSYEHGLTILTRRGRVWRIVLKPNLDPDLDYKEYKGALPLGVKRHLSPEGLISRLGKPTNDDGSKDDRWLIYDKSQYSYTFVFDGDILRTIMIDGP